jgi:hypothetical protein
VRRLQRLGLTTRVAQLVVASVEGGGLLRPQRLHDRGGLAEHREALPERREWDPVLLVLELVPRAAHAQLNATAGHVVDGDGQASTAGQR